MADFKRTRSRTRRKARHGVIGFPQVRGKTVADVRLRVTADELTVTLDFEDKTTLAFDLEPGLSIIPELSDWKTGDYKPLKAWGPIQSVSSRF